MKKRALSLLLCLMMVLSLLPVSAFATEPSDQILQKESGVLGIRYSYGNLFYDTPSFESDTVAWDYDTGTLTLNNFRGKGVDIISEKTVFDEMKLIVKGDCVLSNTEGCNGIRYSSRGVNATGAGTLTIELTEGSSLTIDVSCDNFADVMGDETYDKNLLGGILSNNGNVIVTGSGALSICVVGNGQDADGTGSRHYKGVAGITACQTTISGSAQVDIDVTATAERDLNHSGYLAFGIRNSYWNDGTFTSSTTGPVNITVRANESENTAAYPATCYGLYYASWASWAMGNPISISGTPISIHMPGNCGTKVGIATERDHTGSQWIEILDGADVKIVADGTYTGASCGIDSWPSRAEAGARAPILVQDSALKVTGFQDAIFSGSGLTAQIADLVIEAERFGIWTYRQQYGMGGNIIFSGSTKADLYAGGFAIDTMDTGSYAYGTRFSLSDGGCVSVSGGTDLNWVHSPVLLDDYNYFNGTLDSLHRVVGYDLSGGVPMLFSCKKPLTVIEGTLAIAKEYDKSSAVTEEHASGKLGLEDSEGLRPDDVGAEIVWDNGPYYLNDFYAGPNKSVNLKVRLVGAAAEEYALVSDRYLYEHAEILPAQSSLAAEKDRLDLAVGDEISLKSAAGISGGSSNITLRMPSNLEDYGRYSEASGLFTAEHAGSFTVEAIDPGVDYNYDGMPERIEMIIPVTVAVSKAAYNRPTVPAVTAQTAERISVLTQSGYRYLVTTENVQPAYGDPGWQDGDGTDLVIERASGTDYYIWSFRKETEDYKASGIVCRSIAATPLPLEFSQIFEDNKCYLKLGESVTLNLNDYVSGGAAPYTFSKAYSYTAGDCSLDFTEDGLLIITMGTDFWSYDDDCAQCEVKVTDSSGKSAFSNRFRIYQKPDSDQVPLPSVLVTADSRIQNLEGFRGMDSESAPSVLYLSKSSYMWKLLTAEISWPGGSQPSDVEANYYGCWKIREFHYFDTKRPNELLGNWSAWTNANSSVYDNDLYGMDNYYPTYLRKYEVRCEVGVNYRGDSGNVSYAYSPVTTIYVSPVPEITDGRGNSRIASGVIGEYFEYYPTADYIGMYDAAWSVAEGTLPTGLVLDSVTGRISGVPIEAGSFDFRLSAETVFGIGTSRLLQIRITKPNKEIALYGIPNDSNLGVRRSGETDGEGKSYTKITLNPVIKNGETYLWEYKVYTDSERTAIGTDSFLSYQFPDAQPLDIYLHVENAYGYSADYTFHVEFYNLPTIRVNGGRAMSPNGTSITSAEVGETVTILTYLPLDEVLDHWNVDKGKIALADAAGNPTTFVMPDEDVEVTPVFKKALVPESLTITNPPFQTTYYEGDSFRKEGMQVEVTYDNGTHETVSDYTVSPAGPLTFGTDHVTLSITRYGETLTTELPITVKPMPDTVPVFTLQGSVSRTSANAILVTVDSTNDGRYIAGTDKAAVESALLADYPYELIAGSNTVPSELFADLTDGQAFTLYLRGVTADGRYGDVMEVIVPAYQLSVTFESNGTVVETLETVPYGTVISAPKTPDYPGHLFRGWYRDADGTMPWNFETDSVTEHMALYAKWEEGYTVQVSGGSFIAYGADGNCVPKNAEIMLKADIPQATFSF